MRDDPPRRTSSPARPTWGCRRDRCLGYSSPMLPAVHARTDSTRQAERGCGPEGLCDRRPIGAISRRTIGHRHILSGRQVPVKPGVFGPTAGVSQAASAPVPRGARRCPAFRIPRCDHADAQLSRPGLPRDRHQATAEREAARHAGRRVPRGTHVAPEVSPAARTRARAPTFGPCVGVPRGTVEPDKHPGRVVLLEPTGVPRGTAGAFRRGAVWPGFRDCGRIAGQGST